MAETQGVDHFKGQPQLPKFAVPRKYEIFLKPDLRTCKFSGNVLITVDVVEDTRFLVLNAAELSIENGSVWFRSFSSSQKLQPLEIVAVEKDEILVLVFGEFFPHGVGVLEMNFEGVLNDRMKGFYRSVYNYNGEDKDMAVTQFEPADARRCFPCWDEPAFKATFKMILEVPSDHVALSNMPVTKEEVSSDVKKLFFQESPLMSTYLVAVVVGLFEFVEAYTTDGTHVRVYTQVGKSSQGKFSLDVAVKTLELYKEYFAVAYALPKLDMVAIPDFSAGAMENYGLVTYRETALLYDECHSAAANKQRVATVVAHELAHQWFGNLVTMEWWTHLWLNEGFATWVSYLAADSIFPEWKIWTQFLDDTVSGLRLDALSESHPIEVEINHASEIDEIFDAISYQKGASLIRMLQSYLGADCFQKSLASYVKKFAYSNAKTEDLWNVLEEESGEPVKALMNSWTKQKGYPVVNVTIKDGQLELEQVSCKVIYMIEDANPELSDDIKHFVIGLLQHSAERLGWDPKEGESHLDAMLRGEILSALAQLGHSITQNEGLRRFNAFFNDRDTTILPPDIRRAAYVCVMRNVDKSNKSGYESLLKIYRESDLSQEKTRILSCLADSPDPDAVLEALNFLLSSEVRNQDAFYVLGGISEEGRDIAWKWLKDNWDYIAKTWGSGHLLTSFVRRVVSSFSSEEKAVEIEEFFASRITPAISRTLKQSLERVRVNANWVRSIRRESSLAEVVKQLAYRKP
ncbi:hypothetical protein HPP92_023997 [Vanilla planifolia]|uniref:Aminopeptidase n=1 Tax=Vanilla planifolia TaxID=51239 RepID=A0A835UB51_VANPL|nr:hypothetical protein HPP92_023997 [Vanilla planifolia]